ncbi:MAG: phenylacetate-CoA oxygenase subunit PaaC [Segetibacter sp.]|nr:phenylacetate-CoA oxygenase subunit PaaC [Segetibacter sp.]
MSVSPNNQSTDQSIHFSTSQHINFSTTQLINYTLHLADNALILGHGNSEWTGHGPVLEQDIAISNIALDLIGQSRYLYQYAADLINQSNNPFPPVSGRPVTEDDLAYLRDVLEFKNCILVEQPNRDWAQTILRQFFFSAYQYFFYEQLKQSSDERLSAIAEKSLKETTYHLRWSGDWVIRLGDGTEDSHSRMLKAIDELWMFTGELFEIAPYDEAALQNGIGVNVKELGVLWKQKVTAVFEEATLPVPQTTPFQKGGKTGIHSEHLGFILAEMQFLQRAYPNSQW